MEDRRASSVIDVEEIPELSAAQRENLLRRSWMTNDGLWFYQAFVNNGSEAGVAQVYHCGPFERVLGWFEALRLPVKISPEVGLCQMAQCGDCRYTLSVEFDAEPAGGEA